PAKGGPVTITVVGTDATSGFAAQPTITVTTAAGTVSTLAATSCVPAAFPIQPVAPLPNTGAPATITCSYTYNAPVITAEDGVVTIVARDDDRATNQGSGS